RRQRKAPQHRKRRDRRHSGRRISQRCHGRQRDPLRSEPPAPYSAMSLFEPNPLASSDEPIDKTRPLAERMRPRSLDEYVSQEHILGPGKPLRMQIERDQLSSMILWGPPGVGKTSLARLIARQTRCDFVPFSAVTSGIKEVKTIMSEAEHNRKIGRRTV